MNVATRTDEARATAHWLRDRLAPGARLCADSRQVRRGDAFFAYPGARGDGRHHIAQALARGAAALVQEAADEGPGDTRQSAVAAVPCRQVAGLKRLSGPIAAEFFDRPSERFELIAVTGTNGKTSCTQWIAQGLSRLGRRCGVIGTLGAGFPGEFEDTGLTTPDALTLQAGFARFAAQGATHVALEASSIGLDQGRLDASRVAVAVFTNLTRDHLDHHGTLEAYAAAKARLFGWPQLRCAVLNLDDPWTVRMAEPLDRSTHCIVYGLQTAPAGGGRVADAPRLLAGRIEHHADGMSFDLEGDFGRARVRTARVGRFNVSNLLAVAAAWIACGLSFEEAAATLPGLAPVPGRLEPVVLRGVVGPAALVDYAHTPDALAQVLEALVPMARARGGRLWCVVGAGGDRDPGKRPEMGRVAERWADRVVLTSDNPRSEPPEAILTDIRAGMSHEPYAIESDRAQAIRLAVLGSDTADVILVAGKGHETYQEVAGERLPFSDPDCLLRTFAERGPRASGGGVS